MSESLFFRLLNTPIEDKGEILAEQVTTLNAKSYVSETYAANTDEFAKIPGSPFAYWVSTHIRKQFETHSPLQSDDRKACFGLSTKNDFRFLRLTWEVTPSSYHKVWFPFVKGGAYSPYYYDVHLVIDWEKDGERLKAFANQRTMELFGTASWSRWINNWDNYFRPGLTWPRRTGGFSVRAMPAGCIFADKGPAAFVLDDAPAQLMALQAVMNSAPFEMLVRVQLARTELAQSYEVGLIQNTPIPIDLSDAEPQLSPLAREAHDLQRQRDLTDETTHAFCLPGLASAWAGSLLDTDASLVAAEDERQARLKEIQDEIDEIVFDLYGLGEEDRALIRAEMGQPVTASDEETEPDDEDDDDEVAASEDLPLRVQNLLMWCVGAAFGRWDVRKALDPSLLPPLGGPFDPLPRCAPGALMGPEGLPAAPNEVGDDYPLPIAWNGILVDDPANRASDIVERVRGVLALLWGDEAGSLERDMLAVLGVDSLREYFRHPRRFFDFHIKRYSKSRRKAPIYWLLQSEKRSYGIWLYLHHLRHDTLYVAARDYADAKVALEQTRLRDLQQGLDALAGGERKRREREIDQQDKLVAEVADFRATLDRLALLNLPPDLNDGVVLSIAPLHPLVPWKEAGRYWNELIRGKHEWSTMSQQMRAKGLVKG